MAYPTPTLHGRAPYTVAVLHGGPGAPGSVTTLARELAPDRGVLEPFQSRPTIAGQVAELHAVLTAHAARPVALVGWSWGAFLAFIFAARHPEWVRRLVLVSSGPYEAAYAARIMPARRARLSPADRVLLDTLFATLGDPASPERSGALAQVGALLKNRADSVDLLPHTDETRGVDHALHEHVWAEAAALRHSGDLLALGRAITCPVVAIHGADDPHPAAGVREPLARTLTDFRVVVLARCGHYPWWERHAREPFFAALRDALDG